MILNESLFEAFDIGYALDSNTKKQIDLDIKKAWGKDYPGEGCIFIHPDGSFLNIYPKLDDHEDLCYWLEDEGYDSDYIVEDPAWLTDTFNYIRCRNSVHLCFIALPDSKVTSAQLDSLERWMEEKVTSDYIDVVIENTDEQQHYSTEEYFPEDIIKRIRRFYSSGTLYESITNNEQLYRETAQQVRKEIIDKYSEDFLYGKCIEASEKIVALLSKEGINSKTIEGWVHYDCDEGCTDRDYDEHTWVETADGYIIDVTATQFNSFMEEDYPDIIISKELPYGYFYDDPDAYEDSDLDDQSYKNLFERKNMIEKLPQYLYHATYPHRWKMIKQAGGLKTHLNRRLRNWSDSRDVICLSEDPDVAESYAETALDELDKDWDIIVLKIDTKYLDKNYLSYDANILYDEEDAEVGFEQTEYEYSKDIPLEAISLTLVEAAKRKKNKKRISDVKAGDPIFKSVNDMKKWVKKRQKGLSPFCYLNPNAGNVPLSNSIFNSMFSSDGSSGVGTSEGGVSNGGLSIGSGDASGGMGESFNPDLKLKLHYTKSLSDYLTSTEQEFIRNNIDLIDSESWLELRDEVDNTFDYPLTTRAIFKFLADGLGYDFTYFEELLKL